MTERLKRWNELGIVDWYRFKVRGRFRITDIESPNEIEVSFEHLRSGLQVRWRMLVTSKSAQPRAGSPVMTIAGEKELCEKVM